MFTENDVLRTTAVHTAVLSVGALLWRSDVALGILLGGLTSILALRLMIIDGTILLQKTAEGSIDSRGAYRYTFKGFLKRCSLYSIALIIGTLNPYLNFLATLAGLLMPRVAILYHLLLRRTKRGT